jgi:hypothetical protein
MHRDLRRRGRACLKPLERIEPAHEGGRPVGRGRDEPLDLGLELRELVLDSELRGIAERPGCIGVRMDWKD